MTHSAPTSSDGDSSPAGLWEAARYAVRWLVNLFGSPSELAGLGVLAPRERSDVLSYLRPLEALVRALLVIKAAETPAPEAPPRPTRKTPKRSRRLVEHDPEQSERWRVSFRALPQPPGLPQVRRRPPRGLPSAWPLAERLEAVIRVLESPEPFARRLARRLRAQPGDAARVLRPPPNETRVRPGDWAFCEARAQALSAVRRLDSG